MAGYIIRWTETRQAWMDTDTPEEARDLVEDGKSTGDLIGWEIYEILEVRPNGEFVNTWVESKEDR